MESELFVTVCKPLCDKVDILKTNIEFLKSIKNNESDIKIVEKIDSTVNLMLNDMKELQILLEEQQAIYNETKVEEVEISHLLYKVNVLHMGTNQEDSENNSFDSSGDCTNSKQINACADLSPIQISSAPSTLLRKNLKPRSIAFGLAYLEEEEYKLLPKYMVGRLTLQSINTFIDVINDAFSKKYNILSKKMSTLKNQELNLFKNYKHQQTSELKGKHFIVEGDIAREFNKPGLEKKSYSFLTILRHTKRLLRNQINGVIVYIATTD